MAEQAVDLTDYPDVIFDHENNERPPWKICNLTIPRSEVVFFTQVIVVFIILTVSLTKLFLNHSNCEEQTIWISLLSAAVGYILPNPKL